MNAQESILEPLLGKRRRVREALVEVAERWQAHPLAGAGARAAVEDAVRHKLLRAAIAEELPAGIDAAALARAFVDALVAGEGRAAVDRVVPPAG